MPATVATACIAAKKHGHSKWTRRWRTADEDQQKHNWNKMVDLCDKEAQKVKDLAAVMRRKDETNRTLTSKLLNHKSVKLKVMDTYDKIVKKGMALKSAKGPT
jgi:hypothetical protein